ncbi:hypothetical protein ANN_08099 [Periplaneta americana]|uniref:Uncharacterized protein n=1 Tax=Periplaneta americana TaxID=6978 RepID=A0ABQ8T1V3_PERAM|nr:hypothetical protein ANN_08099 [Periplaneta americana]
MGESRNAYRVLVGRPEGKRPLERPRHRWEDNIKMDLREVGYDDKEWINLVQDRDRWRAYVRAAMNLRVPHTRGGRKCDQVITGRDEEEMAGVNLNIEMNCVISQCRRSREDSVVCPCTVLDIEKNDAETDQKEEKELVGSLTEKKLPSEGCTGGNGEREKSSGQKKISDDRRH